MEEVLAVLKFESLPRPISVFSSADGKALDNLNARTIAAAVINLFRSLYYEHCATLVR
jgi:hypothetical protein